MSEKRVFTKRTILDYEEYENNTKRIIQDSLKRVWQFSVMMEGNNRSSSKTDFLHKNFSKSLIEAFGDHEDNFKSHFNLVVEKDDGNNKTIKINNIKDIFGTKFKVDMTLNRGDDIDTVFLLKAPLTSINKNRYNMMLNCFGEIDRFYGNPENENIELVFVNFIPTETFVKKEKEGVISKEKVNYLSLNANHDGCRVMDKLPKTKNIKEKIKEINIEYSIELGKDLDDFYSYESLKEAINNDEFEIKITDFAMEEFKNYIENFIIRNNNLLNISVEKYNNKDKAQLRIKM